MLYEVITHHGGLAGQQVHKRDTQFVLGLYAVRGIIVRIVRLIDVGNIRILEPGLKAVPQTNPALFAHIVLGGRKVLGVV